MIVDYLKRKLAELKKEDPNTGKRFAIRYSELATPIYWHSDHPYRIERVKNNVHYLDFGKIGRLWTVVEVLPNGCYLDLVTNEVYLPQMLTDNIPDTVTPEYLDRAIEIRDNMLTRPLGIEFSAAQRKEQGGVDLETQKAIIEQTIPRKEEIIALIMQMKQQARQLIKSYYEKKNQERVEESYDCAILEDREREIEARKRAFLEQQRILAERKEQEEETLRREVAPKFELLFPKKRK